MMGWGSGMGFLGWMFMAALGVGGAVALVWAAAVLLPRLAPAPRLESAPTAREILDRRFASGDLTLEQYRQARTEMAGRPDTPR